MDDFTPADSVLAEDRNVRFTHLVWFITGGFIFVVGVFQLGSLVISKLLSRPKTLSDTEQNQTVTRHAASLKRLPLALVNAYRIMAFRWTFTIGSYSLNMAEVLLTIAYIILLYTLDFVATTNLRGEKLSHGYWVNRVASIAVSQLPLLTILGTKNNVLGLITGISYEKLNYMHRMVGRVVTTMLWVHAGSRLQFLRLHPQYWSFTFNRIGLAAALSLLLLFIVSLRPIRSSAYEVFFFVHFSMVAIFLACGYVHTKDSGYATFFWPCFLIWGLDRFVRLVRLVVFNHSYFGFKSGAGTMDATVERLSPDFVRLRLHRPSHFHWKPGQTAYLTMPGVSGLPFEAHPFTIASIDTSPYQNAEEGSDAGIISPYRKELVFFINVHNGFTKRLGEIAAKGGTVKTFVDGPYGYVSDLSGFDTSVLIAGGSGISFTLPLLLEAINKASLGQSNTKRLLFIWAVRNPNHILWVSETLAETLKLAPSTLSISVRVFLTGGDSSSTVLQWDDDVSVTSTTEENKEKNRAVALLGFPAVQVDGNRPDLASLLQEEADLTNGSMSVSVCGSQGVANAVKQALGFSVAGPYRVLKGGPSITLHVEAFGYA